MRQVPKLAAAIPLMLWWMSQSAPAQDLQLEFITQFCNERIETADIASDPRMLRDISNSLMTDAPSFLDQAVYPQRRTNFVNLCPELDGIGEVSQEWLRFDRVSVSEDAVVVAAVREDIFPGAGTLLSGLGWTPLGETITLGYVEGVADIPLYAGLVPAGPVRILGAGVNQLITEPDVAHASLYVLFQETDAFPPETLAALQVVPEPGSAALLWSATIGILAMRLSRKRRQRS